MHNKQLGMRQNSLKAVLPLDFSCTWSINFFAVFPTYFKAKLMKESKRLVETGARSNTFFSFCHFSHNKFFSKFLFNMKNLDHC